MNSTAELAALNKLYRAVQDRVCFYCGSLRMVPVPDGYGCKDCGFYVTLAEMQAMRASIVESGHKIVEVFEAWRVRRAAAAKASLAAITDKDAGEADLVGTT